VYYASNTKISILIKCFALHICCDCCSYERSYRCRSTPERRLHQPAESPSSTTCQLAPPPPPAAVSSDEAPLTSSMTEDPPLYGSAALLHRGIYASVRIRAAAAANPRGLGSGGVPAVTHTATPELVTVLPAGSCKCAEQDGRKTVPSRGRSRFGVHVGDARPQCGVAKATVAAHGKCVARDTCDTRDTCVRDVGASRTRSLMVVTRPSALNSCPECQTVAAGENTGGCDLPRNYGTLATSP